MCCVWQPRLALLRIALALVVGHHGLAAGPNPSLNAPALSPGLLCGPASSSSGSFTEASGGTLGTGSVSPDFWPLPSHRLRSPGQGILIPDMYPTINEAFHAAKSPDVRRPAFLLTIARTLVSISLLSLTVHICAQIPLSHIYAYILISKSRQEFSSVR